MKHILIASLFAISFLAIKPAQIFAETTSQDQEQEVTVECQSGSYGQNSNCKTTTKQKQNQLIIRNGKVLGAHTPANTGVPIVAVVVFSLLTLSGLSLYAAKKLN